MGARAGLPEGAFVYGDRAALAHIVQNEVEAAYGPSDVVERRRQLMDDWFPYVVDGTGSAA